MAQLLRRPPAALQIDLFGEPVIRLHGNPLPSLNAKAMQLLALLVIRRAAPTSRRLVAYTLWPDNDEESALANVRRQLYLIKRALRTVDPIAALGDALWWQTSAEVEVDVIEFERQIDEECNIAAAVAQYHGDLLEPLAEDWLEMHRERYRRRYLEALADQVDRELRRRNWVAAERFAREWLNTDPWSELGCRRLMKALYRLGDRARAVVEFNRFAQRLHAELSIEPMAETLQLRDTIVRAESAFALAS